MRVQKVIILFLALVVLGFCMGTYPDLTAAVQNDTEIGMKIAPLQQKLGELTTEDIELYINKYKDLRNHFARTQIGRLTAIEVLSGVGGNYFNPDSTLQADYFIKMLVCAMGFKAGAVKGNTTGTVSVKPYWAQQYIDTGMKYGLIKPKEILSFNKPITREMIAKILMRAVMLVEEAPDNKYEEYIMGKLKDYYKVADTCKQSVLDACKMGMMTGSNNVFDPKGYLTRAQAAVAVLRFLDVKERKPVKPGTGEVLKIQTNMGEWTEIYPGAIPETFVIVKAAVENVSKAEGYVSVGLDPSDGVVFANFYGSKADWEKDCIITIGRIKIDCSHKNKYVFTLTVNDTNKYKNSFNDYVIEVLKVLYTTEKGKSQAIDLHDKYMNAKYSRKDGFNDYTEITIDNRNSAFIRYNEAQFGIQLKLFGEK